MADQGNGFDEEYVDAAKAESERKRNVDLVIALKQTPVWNLVLKPMCEDRIRRHMRLLRMRTRARMDTAPDDYLVGRWDEAEAWLNEIENLVRDWEMERNLSQVMGEHEANLRMLASYGRFSPITSAPPVPERNW